MAKKLHLTTLWAPGGTHEGAWRHPEAGYDGAHLVENYVAFAKAAERGLFDAVFLGDGQSAEHWLSGRPLEVLEPITTLSAVARETRHIGLVATISTSFPQPFQIARLLASLDHISNGRAGWNVVTSSLDQEARNYGLPALLPREDRYARAAEFIEVVRKLWNSWEADAVVRDVEQARFHDFSKIHRINHDGAYFKVEGPLNLPRSPQGGAAIFQAGMSDSGKDLAARYASGIYCSLRKVEQARDYYADVKARVAAAGRNPEHVAVLPGLSVYVGGTEAEALKLRDELDALQDPYQALARLGRWVGPAYLDWQLDEPVPPLPDPSEVIGLAANYANIVSLLDGPRRLTTREFALALIGSGRGLSIAGTPEQIVDEIAHWVETGASDGFNIRPPLLPRSLDDFVDQIVPLLQKRGLFREAYDDGTLLDRLAGDGRAQ